MLTVLNDIRQGNFKNYLKKKNCPEPNHVDESKGVVCMRVYRYRLAVVSPPNRVRVLGTNEMT